MADDTAKLVVALSAQLTQFEKDMKGAVAVADTNTKAIETRFAKMNSEISSQLQGIGSQFGGGLFNQFITTFRSIGPIGATVVTGLAAVGLAFGKVIESVHEFISEAQHLRDTADTTGLTIFQLKELTKAGLEVGVGAESVDSAVSKMTVAIDNVREATGPLYDKLKKVPDVLLQITTAKDAGSAIDALAKHFATLDSEFEKNAFLRAVFGRGGLPFGRVLQQIFEAGGLNKLQQDAGEAGKKFNEVVKQVDDLADEIARLADEAKDMWGTLLAPSVLKGLRDIVLEWRDLAAFVVRVVDKIKELPNSGGAPPPNRVLPNLQFPQPIVQPRGTTGTTGAPVALEGTFPPQVGGVSPQDIANLQVPVPLPTAKPDLTLEQRIETLKRYISVMGDVLTVTKKLQLGDLELQRAVEQKTITPEEANRKRTVETIDLMIETLQKEIAAKGKSADSADEAQLAELRLQRAKAAGVLTSKQATTALEVENKERRIAVLSAKEAANVATEADIKEKEILQTQLTLQKVRLTGIDLTNQEILAEKKAKEAIEQREVALSNLPQTVRAAQDAMSGFKNADQFLTSFASNFESALGDIATSSKTVAEAFKSLTDSIIKDLVRIAVRMTITGPLLKTLGGAFGGGGVSGAFNPFAFLNPTAKQSGGPVSAGAPYIVGEHGPELFVPGQSGKIVPNSVSGRSAGGSQMIVNNYVAADTSVSQRKENNGLDGERYIIDIVRKAQTRGDLDSANRGRFALRPQKVR